MSLIRAFIAVELPAELKKELAALETQFKKNSPPVIKWIEPGSIHITLKFLGDTSDTIIGELMLAMEESVRVFHHLNWTLVSWAHSRMSTGLRLSGRG